VTKKPDQRDSLGAAVKTRRERRALWQRQGERSIGQNLAMIGALGWTIVTPTLIGIFCGRWLDRQLGACLSNRVLLDGGEGS
jgi:ATP synthase protein I